MSDKQIYIELLQKWERTQKILHKRGLSNDPTHKKLLNFISQQGNKNSLYTLTSMAKIKKQKMSSVDEDIGQKESHTLREECNLYNHLGKLYGS